MNDLGTTRLEVKKRYDELERTLGTLIRDARDKAEREAREAFKTELQDLESLRSQLADLDVRIKQNVKAENEARSLASGLVGRKVFRKDNRDWRGGSPAAEGQVEIFRLSERNYPENLAGYSLPYDGSLIIRIARKDGTLGKKFERFRYDWDEKTNSYPPALPHGWQFEE